MIGKRTLFLIGVAATLASGALWHGPLGAGERMAGRIEVQTRQLLINWDLPEVTGHVRRDPLSRAVILEGPANDFQQREAIRLVQLLPGVEEAEFVGAPRSRPLPLVVEAELAALIGFGIGLIIAYLGELRRRSHQWDRF